MFIVGVFISDFFPFTSYVVISFSICSGVTL